MAHVPLIFFHLRLVARVSVAVGALACAALFVALFLITGETGDSYGAIIGSHSLTREYLGAAMLVAGLVLVAITGFITWLIALYSNHRIAGPLYRFSQNLKLATSSDVVELVPRRRGDALSRQAGGVKLAVATLREHYAQTRAASELALAALAAGDADQYAQAVARLKVLDEKVRI